MKAKSVVDVLHAMHFCIGAVLGNSLAFVPCVEARMEVISTPNNLEEKILHFKLQAAFAHDKGILCSRFIMAYLGTLLLSRTTIAMLLTALADNCNPSERGTNHSYYSVIPIKGRRTLYSFSILVDGNRNSYLMLILGDRKKQNMQADKKIVARMQFILRGEGSLNTISLVGTEDTNDPFVYNE
eukprot:Gb_25086 [translate_table: standard]